MSFRKVRFWVRILPKEGRRKHTTVLEGVYTSKKKADAAKAKRAGQISVSVEGFYWREDELVLNKQGRWVRK